MPGKDTKFKSARSKLAYPSALKFVHKSLQTWNAPTEDLAKKWLAESYKKFPNQYEPDAHWDEAAGREWNNWFSWGHDHDFGFGHKREGSMTTRHIEIAAEAISWGMLPKSLSAKTVLDVGCWTGGDLLLLAAMGASVMGLEGDPISTKAAQHLCRQVGCDANIINADVYEDRKAWKQKFDLIYCTGVVYHVSDPVLMLRILFGYLKVGGSLIIETKAQAGKTATASYSGTLEKGWNWFAPTRQTLGRWFVDAGFNQKDVIVNKRTNGRLLGCAKKAMAAKMPDSSGISRPGTWLCDII